MTEHFTLPVAQAAETALAGKLEPWHDNFPTNPEAGSANLICDRHSQLFPIQESVFMTSSTTARPLRPGDLALFRFPYAEENRRYPRPCLVLEATTAELLLAYGTTSRGRANQGLEIRLNRDFAACGLDRPTRFVAARRVRVARADPGFVPHPQSGTSRLGRLPDVLQERLSDLIDCYCADFATPGCRYRAERAGIHPRRGRPRRVGRALQRCKQDPDA